MEDFLFYFNAYRVPAQHVIAFLLAGAAWRWGGAPERWLTLAFLATMVVPVYLAWWLLPAISPDEPIRAPILFFDMVAAAIFTGIALKANRNYPLWVAGFQLVSLGAYLVKAVAPVVSPLALVILIVGPSYCQLLLLIIGFVRHIRRERRFGPYRAWRIAPPAIGGVAV